MTNKEALNRAITDKQKEEIMGRLLALWKTEKLLRLGQLIENAFKQVDTPIYYTEDYDLIDKLEKYYKDL